MATRMQIQRSATLRRARPWGVSARPELGVVGPGTGVTGRADACPVVEGIAESFVASAAYLDGPALAASTCDGSLASVGAKGVAVARGDEAGGLGQEDADREGAQSRGGAEDVDVTGSIVVVLVSELIEKSVELFEAALVLLVDDPESRQEEADMDVSGLGGSGSEAHAGLPEDGEDFVGIEAADAVALEKLVHGPALDAGQALGPSMRSTSSQNQASSAEGQSWRR